MKTKFISILLVFAMLVPFFNFVAQAEEPALTNVFLGKDIVVDLEENTSYPVTMAVDGTNNTWKNRYASKNNYTSSTSCVMTVSLGTVHTLSYIVVYEWLQLDNVTSTYTVAADITSDGVENYTTIKSGSTLLPYNTITPTTITFDDPISTDKVKITISRDNTTSKTFSICEIEGYGYEGTYTPPAVDEPEEEEETVDSAGYDALKLWYNTPAIDDDKGSTMSDATGVYSMTRNGYMGWEHQALPLGNGYLGAMVFGRTDSERIQLTENSLSTTEAQSGLTNFAETYIDFNHTEADVTNYYRDLNLDEGTSHVSYTYGGVDYEREYITSHPDKVMAIKLTASGNAKLSFTLRPTIPYIHEGTSSIAKKTGTVSASGDTVTIKGVYGAYNVKYEGQFTVVPQGDSYTMTAANDENGDNGTITLTEADSAIIYIAIGTNYPLNDPNVISASNSQKLANGCTAEELTAKLKGYIDTAKQTGYDKIRQNHLADYQEYFGRVKLDLDTEVPDIPTDELVDAYRQGTYNSYLEVLLFHYGRYMLICSSREGTLPANLQGIWNRYRSGVCMVGYWHNVNVQLTYWPVFVTNLTDMFKSYTDYFDTILPTIKERSTKLLETEGLDVSESGDNGWNIGTGASPYHASTGKYAYTGNDGNGCGPFLAETFWDYYRFTGDINLLKDWVYPVIRDCANYSSRVVSDTGDGLYLTRKSASPENHVNGSSNYQPLKGDLYPQGTTYDQSLIYDVMNYALTAADILKDAGLMTEEEYNTDEALVRCRERIGKLDPIKIGTSGQIKEFREENYYAEYGQASHRHISHLMGIYPGTIINYDTPAWQDAAKTTLPLRNSSSTDWKWAMTTRAVVWSRLGDGNQAMAQMRKMAKAPNGLRANLLTGTPTFQIDGNCGSTAAFAEMLLQSHMGYIQPLAALPDDWSKGSFDGMLARGAFEIGTTWNDGKATQIRILSQKGNDCVIKYPGIGSCKLVDSAGNEITYTKNADDMITFATKEGMSYTVSSIPAVAETNPVTDLAITDTELSGENRKTTLGWTASADAEKYNVYYATNDSATYTLAGSTMETSYQIDEEFSSESDRVTYAVTAVSADGVESDRVWLNENPLGPISKAEGSLNEDEEFVITITPTYAVDYYNIYKTDMSGTESFVTSSAETSTMILRASPFFETYIVRSVEEGIETAQAEVAFLENAALGKTVNVSTKSYGDNFAASYITDGNTDTRYVAYSSYTTNYNTYEFELGAVYKLSKLALTERWESKFTSAQSGMKIETGITTWDGVTTWTTHTDSFMKSTGSSGGTNVTSIFTFDDIVQADRIRITDNRSAKVSDKYEYNIVEFEAFGVYHKMLGSTNIALGKPVTEKSGHTANTALPLKNITDGNTSSRYATNYNKALKDMVLELDLENLYMIDRAEFWQYYLTKYANILTGVDIESGVTIDDVTRWTPVCSDIIFSGSNGRTSEVASVVFDDVFLADKIRFTFKIDTTDVDTVTEKISHTISEIMIYGYELSSAPNIAEGVLAETNLAPQTSYYKEANMTNGKSYTTGFSTGALGRNKPLEITLHLDGIYNIYKLRINELISDAAKTACDKVKVEMGCTSGGTTKWETSRENVCLASGNAGDVTGTNIILDKAYKADKVRITLECTDTVVADYGYNIPEIRVYGDNKLNNFGLKTVKLLSDNTEKEFTNENIKSENAVLNISYRGLSDGTPLTAFVAYYDNSGNVIHVAKGSLANGSLNIDTSVTSNENISKIRIYTWDNITDIKPLIQPFTKQITKE